MLLKCKCEKPPFHYLNFERNELGYDVSGGEVAEEICNECGTKWLVYLLEEPHYTKSGRWWRIKVTNEEYTKETVKEIIESKEWCFVGGSFYDSQGKKVNAPIKIT